MVVIEPDELSVSTSKSSNSKKVTISLSGGSSYYVSLNNETTITGESEIELELTPGANDLSIKTNKDCQGVYNETIVFNIKPVVFPNPIKNNLLNINSVDFYKQETPIEIYDLTGKLLFSKIHKSETNQLNIDVSKIPNGMYLLKIVIADETFNYKIIK